MEYRRVSRKGSSQYDVHLDEVPEEALGAVIAQSIVTKGFCVISPGFFGEEVEKTQADAEGMDFYQLSTVVAEGILGAEGSAHVAEVTAISKESIQEVDNAITRLGHIVAPHVGGIGIDMTHRSPAVVSRAGEADDDAPPLSEKAVTKWQSQFLRQKIMAVAFLGPRLGFLELQPFDDEEEFELCQVRTVPGMIVLLRADAMSHKHSVPGASMAVSAFFMKGEVSNKRVPEGGFHMTPTAQALEEWSGNRLRELKEAEEDDPNQTWDDEIPRVWQQMMNHTYFKGQISGVTGTACHFPRSYDPDAWFRASGAGVDYVTEIPLLRWNHEDVYDAELDSWKNQKTYCKHASFMDGCELFDNKFFSLSAHESGQLDPHARMLLEVGYSAFANAGYKKKQLMNAAGGVYVGCTNHEYNFAVGAGVSGILCMLSGRISFCLGMKGPALSMSTEAASGLTAVFHAAESVLKKGTAVSNDFALATAASLCLSAVWWPTFCQNGWLSPEGRCMTFNSAASGFVRGDGCGSIILKSKTEVVDGSVVLRDDDKFLGTIAGGMMSNSGQSASLSAPNAAAEQEVIAQAVRNAAVAHADVDGVECHGSGAFLADAIETNAIWRAHRNEAVKERLTFTAAKTSMGNQIECNGLTAILKVLFAAQWNHLTPNLHLRQVNPHIDPFEHPVDLVNESIDFPFRSTFQGVKARGLGGANVYVLAWGQVDPDRRPPPPPELDRQFYLPNFWPGGGGELEDAQKPRRRDGYTIAGSWTGWKSSEKMEPTGDGNYTYTLTLGENRWEKFQIWLDGESKRPLHPGVPKAPQGSPVYGPEDESGIPLEPAGSPAAPSWILDGRYYGEGEAKNPDEGKCGDKYLIKLEISGKWQMVSWEKLEAAPAIEDAAAVVGSTSSYYLAADWNDWVLQPMEPDSKQPGLFKADVKLVKRAGEFQIVREKDWDQAFYPAVPNATPEADVYGPDDEGYGFNWNLMGVAGDEFCIEFQRTTEDGQDMRKVSWRKTGHVSLIKTQVLPA